MSLRRMTEAQSFFLYNIHCTLYNIGLDKKIFGDKSVFLNFSFGCKFNLSKWSNFAQFKIIYILIK